MHGGTHPRSKSPQKPAIAVELRKAFGIDKHHLGRAKLRHETDREKLDTEESPLPHTGMAREIGVRDVL